MRKVVAAIALLGLLAVARISFADQISLKTKALNWIFPNQEKDILQIGYRLRTFNSLDTASQPIGFATTSSDQTRDSMELSLQAKFRRFGLEYLPIGNTRTLDTKFYGSSLGGVTVTTVNVFVGKFFPVDLSDWSLSLGLGAEYTKMSGAVSMGGFDFPTTGKGWSPVFQIGGWYRLQKRLSLGADYELSNVRIVTSIPGVPDLASTYTDRLSVRLMFGLF